MQNKYKLSDCSKEKRFQKQFVENSKKVLPGATYIFHEFPLVSADKVLTTDTMYSLFKDGEEVRYNRWAFGRIDLVFRYYGVIYCAEVKFMERKNYDFWDSLKIIGYTEYFKWQEDKTKVKPAVLIPYTSIKLEHRIVANSLGLSVFLIYEEDDGSYIVKPMENTRVL